MSNTTPISATRHIVGYGYEGGISLDYGCRPSRHKRLSRTNHRRKMIKRQRADWKADLENRAKE